MLSIIIPRYNETPTQVLPLLASIRSQTAINLDEIEIIISNDNPKEQFNIDSLGLNISIINAKENKGSGIARQRGLDKAKGEYVMFCDADDSLHNVGVLSAFKQEFERFPECDYMQSKWLEEIKVGDSFKYTTHEMENTWLHGKIFKRDLLQTARFHEDLRVHEDSYYLSLIADATQNRRQLNIISYVWKWREDSITRTKGQLYEYKDFPNFIKAIFLANKELKKRGSEQIQYRVVQNYIYCYFVLMQDKWFSQDKYRIESLDMLRVCMREFWDVYFSADKELLCRVYNEERGKIYKNEIEKYTLNLFTQTLLKGDKQNDASQ